MQYVSTSVRYHGSKDEAVRFAKEAQQLDLNCDIEDCETGNCCEIVFHVSADYDQSVLMELEELYATKFM